MLTGAQRDEAGEVRYKPNMDGVPGRGSPRIVRSISKHGLSLTSLVDYHKCLGALVK